jgi:hypothetical protein
MEKAKGTSLGDAWYRLSRPSKNKFIEQVVEMESKLASISFPVHGCIYYTQDLPVEYRSKDRPLLPGDDVKEFSMGPAVDPILWCDGRSEMGLSRGTCKFSHTLQIHKPNTCDRASAG